MKRTGVLNIISNVAQLAGTRLARASAGDPFGAAINFLANRGLDDGDFIWVTGTDGFVGTLPAMFIAEAGSGLAGMVPANALAAAIADESTRSAGSPQAAEKARKTGAKKSGARGSSKKGSAKKSTSKKSGKE